MCSFSDRIESVVNLEGTCAFNRGSREPEAVEEGYRRV
jgi:hypothetical protein